MNSLGKAGVQGQGQLLVEARSIVAGLFSSSEYTSLGRSDEEYVQDLYWTYFDRSPDAYSVNMWAGQLQNGTISREGLRQVCENWGEFATLVTALWGGNTLGENERTEHFLWNIYLGAVGAVPSQTQMQPHIDAINAATAEGEETLIARISEISSGLIADSAYVHRNRTDSEFVSDLYQVFWQRLPDQSGMEYWIREVESSGRADVLSQFANSTAFREVASTLYRETLWLIPDQLGTPRMIAEKTGSLAGIKRHDYLPFGEEIMAGIGGRSAQQGYVSDNVRQQFTGQERDDETGLDYFNARYHSPTQGRFTSVDPLMASARTTNPQTWNRYAYTMNNPLRYVDPTGLRSTLPSAGGTREDELREEYEMTAHAQETPQADQQGATATNPGNVVTAEEIEAMGPPPQMPASLMVIGVSTVPLRPVGGPGCTSSSNMGLQVGITYQVMDQSGNPIEEAGMIPQEIVMNEVVTTAHNTIDRGDPVTTPEDMAGPDNPFVPGQSRSTDARGRFQDIPLGVCYPIPHTTTFDQTINIVRNNYSYTVRVQTLTISSTTAGTGSITNGTDINHRRP